MLRTVANTEHTVQIIDLFNRAVVETINVGAWDWSNFAWSPDGKSFAYRRYESKIEDAEKIYIHKLEAKSKLKARDVEPPSGDHSDYYQVIKWSANSLWIASPNINKSFHVFDATSGKAVKILENVKSYEWHSREALLYYTDINNKVFEFNPVDGIQRQLPKHSGPVLRKFREITFSSKKNTRANPISEFQFESISADSTSESKQQILISDKNKLFLSLGIKIETEQQSEISLEASHWPALLPVFQESGRRAYPSHTKVHTPSPDGRWLVTTQLTGREWFLNRNTTADEKAENRAKGFYVSDFRVTHEVLEMEVIIRDLVTDQVYSFIENYTKSFYGAPTSEWFNIIWTAPNSFMIGRQDGNFKPILWTLDENNQQQVVRVDDFSLSTIVHESVAPVILMANDNTLLLMSLKEGVLRVQSLSGKSSFESVEFPMSVLKDDGRIIFPEDAKLEFLGITGAGDLVVDFQEANFGGSKSHVVIIEFKQGQ